MTTRRGKPWPRMPRGKRWIDVATTLIKEADAKKCVCNPPGLQLTQFECHECFASVLAHCFTYIARKVS